MRKMITFLIAFFLFALPIKAYASSTTVEVKVEGEVKKDNNINIILNVKDVESFYAGSVDFIYDTEQLKVNSVNSSDFITGTDDEIMEIGGETAKNGNTANYGFTFIGDKQGISGSGTLVTINATVLSDDKLVINNDNMQLKLVQKVDGKVTNCTYNFIGFGNQDMNNSSNNESTSEEENNTDKRNEQSINTEESIEDVMSEIGEDSNKKTLSEAILNAFKDYNPFSSETSIPKRFISYLVIIAISVGVVFLGSFIYKKIEENR